MPPQKRKLQTRQSRAERMKSAAVKRARAAKGLDGKHVGRRRSGVEYVEPSPTTDAVLAGHPVGFGRQLLIEVGLIVGVMAVLTVMLVIMIRGEGQPLVSAGSLLMVGIMGGTTLVMAAALLVRRWHQSRMLAIKLPRQERQCVSSTGNVRIQARNAGLGTEEHWLLVRESDWMPLDAEALDAIEPLMVARPKIDGPFDIQTGTDVTQEWTIPHATVLFHPVSGTIIEIRNQHGRIAYQHPRYQPSD